ncbi:lipopolysaccharide core heptose(II) kinase RfaY [Fusobacterium sp. IOR10]|uniref:lipopolysaccharide core heptose(II) kinase RfaY n=1 Tax=Fusobacterium sp. IOR10 TaxID=2665157 RepID=UPI0013D13BE3|nr:lipopolysaccharide core heptose(II) kinase RfaY [Fusobacterium sp. IOR10]
MAKYKESKIFFNDFSKIIYNEFKNNNFEILKTLKDDNRSLVQLISIKNQPYILKIPREKNKRKWQRLLSFFREGESKREFKNLKKIKTLGFNSPRPFFSLEYKKYGMTLDSLLVSEYIPGRESSLDDLEKVVNTLNKIHSYHFLHGDSQLTNFMVSNNEIFLIDSKFSRNIYGKFGAAYEFIYLEESCNKDLRNYYDKNNVFYKGAKFLNVYLHWWGNFRKKIRNKK